MTRTKQEMLASLKRDLDANRPEEFFMNVIKQVIYEDLKRRIALENAEQK